MHPTIKINIISHMNQENDLENSNSYIDPEAKVNALKIAAES